MENLGQRVRRLRLGRGLTQAELAKRVPGMTASAISQLENGQTQNIKGDNLVSLAKALSVTPQEVLTGRVVHGVAQEAQPYEAAKADDDAAELMEIWRRLPHAIREHYLERLKEVDNAYAILAKHEVPNTYADVKGRLPSAPELDPALKKAPASRMRKKKRK